MRQLLLFSVMIIINQSLSFKFFPGYKIPVIENMGATLVSLFEVARG